MGETGRSAWETFAGGYGDVVAIGLAFVLVALVCLLFALLFLARRHMRREVRDLVVALEEFRSGKTRRRLEVDGKSPLALVADALNRLGQDLGVRATENAAAREELDALLDVVRDYGVVTADADWDLRSASAGATAMFGWPEEELVSRPASILFDDQAWKDLLPKLARRSMRERGIETRSKLVRRDGTKFDGRVVLRLTRGRTPETVQGFLLVIQDITAQAALEAELAASEARYRDLVERIDAGVMIVRGGRVRYANPAAAKLLGLEGPALHDALLRERVATQDVLLVAEAFARIEGEGEGATDEIRFALRAGDGRGAVYVRGVAVSVVEAGAPAVLATLVDETAERRAEAELRRNESRLDAVVEAASDGIVVIAEEGGGAAVRMTNRAFLEMFGLEGRVVLGLPEAGLARTLREGGLAEAGEILRVEAGTTSRREIVVVRGDRPRVVEVRSAPLEAGEGDPSGKVLVFRDRTDEQEIERRLEEDAAKIARSKDRLETAYEELRTVHEDLERRSKELDRLNQELRTLDEMKSELLANVSHELQTPLVSIRGFTEMILKGRLGAINEEQRRGLTVSLKNVDRLIGMIDNLLAFARMDREAAELHLGLFALRPVVDEAVELIRPRLKERRVTVSVQFDAPGVEVRADRDKVVQVFLNLLTNAVKFNRDGGSVEIRARRGRPGFVAVEIEDTGVGIPPEDLERIFDRFYRVDTTDGQRREGSGIGLAIVRNILRLHGCVIRAQSRVGQGTIFSFTLPLAEGAEVSESPPAESEDDHAGGKAPPPDAKPPGAGPDDGPERPRLRIIRH